MTHRSLVVGLMALVLSTGSTVATAGQERGPRIGPLEGPVTGEEGDALAFGVFVYGHDGPATFTWDFGDDSDRTRAVGLAGVSHEYLDGDSTYTVTVDVSVDGVSRTRTLDVRIRNAAPSIDMLEVQPDIRIEEPVAFVARATDPGDDELTYEWDFGDGSPSQKGVDLTRVRHRFPAAEPYTVTLTVLDEDSLSVVETVTLPESGLRGSVEGALSMELDAEPGHVDWPGAMTSVLPAAPTSTDACTYTAEFVDDAARTGVAMIWVSRRDGDTEAEAYPVVNPTSTGGAPEPGTAVVHLTHATDDGMWARLRDRGAAPPGEDGETDAEEPASGGIGGVVERLKDQLTGSGDRPSPNAVDLPAGAVMPGADGGGTAVFMGEGGTLTVEKVQGRWVHGSVDLALRGHRMRWSTEGFEPFGEQATLEGSFNWPLDEVGRSTRADCVERTFTIERHSPEPNERLVNFLEPAIEIVFTRAFRPESVTDETVRFGFLDADGNFQRVEGELIVDAGARKVRLVPAEPLRSMIYYRVRVLGGPAGVVGEEGDELPDDSYEWRFGTAPRNVPGARGSG